MFHSLSKLFSFSPGNSQRKPAPAPRRVRLGVEVLEDRALPSASVITSPLAPIATNSLIQQATVTTPANVVNVPYLAGVTFTFALTVNGQPYQLTINSETYNADGSASLTCTLKVPGQTGSQTYQARYAYLSYTNGGLHFDSEFDTSASTAITVAGWISTVQNTPVRGGITPTGYHYEFVGAISFFQNQQLQKLFVNVSGEGNPPPLKFLA
jgi:hypothetical protein